MAGCKKRRRVIERGGGGGGGGGGGEVKRVRQGSKKNLSISS